ncbi:enoyl-CoA hydratase-related protein [Tomitella biformata]|uniref:enoyl-CoA hydratase-related protein n=1 Tax=Tomitella biformata TaxID=630403 RepID=UPI000464E640|nr:enoyl-CoA hydratase-related protein [Tomitella biformata]
MSIRIETPADGIRLITIDRPARRNALDHATYSALAAAVRASDEDPETRVSVLTGAGGVFTSGNDIGSFHADGAAAAADQAAPGPAMELLLALATARKPIIAAVEGFAVGIGTTLLLHCDLAYAGHGARFRVPFVPLGLCPEGASSLLLPQSAGLKRATELLMLGEMFSAAEAAEAGVINRAVADGAALEVALERAERIASSPAESVELTKMLLRRPQLEEVLDTLQVEAVHFGRRKRSPEAQAAFARFLGK